MMRLGRRATLLAALSLLTSAATAYAECAWVLWAVPYGPPHGDPVHARPGFGKVIVEGYATLQQCQAAKAKSEDVVVGSQALDEKGYRKGWKDARYVCLPDTVDPREPKGK